jgi:hypothetical protein
MWHADGRVAVLFESRVIRIGLHSAGMYDLASQARGLTLEENFRTQLSQDY